MKLSNRLYACAGLVRPGSHAADIGTDHGYLPIYLISNGICESVVAADLRPMPLQAAKNNALQAGLSNRITFCLSDGLRSVPLEGIDRTSGAQECSSFCSPRLRYRSFGDS